MRLTCARLAVDQRQPLRGGSMPKRAQLLGRHDGEFGAALDGRAPRGADVMVIVDVELAGRAQHVLLGFPDSACRVPADRFARAVRQAEQFGMRQNLRLKFRALGRDGLFCSSDAPREAWISFCRARSSWSSVNVERCRVMHSRTAPASRSLIAARNSIASCRRRLMTHHARVRTRAPMPRGCASSLSGRGPARFRVEFRGDDMGCASNPRRYGQRTAPWRSSCQAPCRERLSPPPPCPRASDPSPGHHESTRWTQSFSHFRVLLPWFCASSSMILRARSTSAGVLIGKLKPVPPTHSTRLLPSARFGSSSPVTGWRPWPRQ